MYERLPPKYYAEEQNNINPISGWFHKKRQEMVYGLVRRYYSDGLRILDVGCGNSLWNERKIPITGLDINEGMLKENLKTGRVSDYIVADFQQGIPVENQSYDLLLMTEVLEHVKDCDFLIKEARRALDKSGKMIISVPFDTNLSLWKPLFFAQCQVKGRIFGNPYYKIQCGHVNHFSPSAIKNLLHKNSFKILESFDMLRLTIFAVAEKAES